MGYSPGHFSIWIFWMSTIKASPTLEITFWNWHIHQHIYLLTDEVLTTQSYYQTPQHTYRGSRRTPISLLGMLKFFILWRIILIYILWDRAWETNIHFMTFNTMCNYCQCSFWLHITQMLVLLLSIKSN